MAKICQISQKSSGETSQSFNRFPICSYLQTTDTTEIIAYQKNQRQVYLRDAEPDTLLQERLTKTLQNWARRKITAQEIAYQLAEHEKQLPKEQRDLRNLKKSFNYQPIQKDGNVLLNRYGDSIYQPTTKHQRVIHILTSNKSQSTSDQAHPGANVQHPPWCECHFVV